MARRRIGVADVAEILVHWDAGEGISGIARSLGYCRPTVRKYVEAAVRAGLQRGARKRRQPGWERLSRGVIASVAAVRKPGAVSAEVGRFHGAIERQIEEGLQLSVIHQRLREDEGLVASWGTFYRYVAAHFGRRRQPPATVRLDDPPFGEEAQVDFFYARRWYDPEAGRERRLHAFLMTLSASRHMFLYPVLQENAESFFLGHVEAFSFFRGAPKRLVPDNLTAAIRRADLYDPRRNRSYAELARHYGCIVDPARVQRPKDKPKVERNVPYARNSFFRGRDFVSLTEMREKARQWCLEVAGRRIHGTTKERPLDSFYLNEQPALLPLPQLPWELTTWTAARVHPDCHLSAGGARYSVPHLLIGKRLDVRLSPSLVTIYDGQKEVATHVRRHAGRSTKVDHYPEAAQAFLRNSPQRCLERAEAIGPATFELVRGLLEVHALHHLREAQAILALAAKFEGRRLEVACRRALDSTDARYRTVRGILEKDLDLVPPEAEPTESVSTGAFLRGPEALLPAGGR
jgi:transposase